MSSTRRRISFAVAIRSLTHRLMMPALSLASSGRIAVSLNLLVLRRLELLQVGADGFIDVRLQPLDVRSTGWRTSDLDFLNVIGAIIVDVLPAVGFLECTLRIEVAASRLRRARPVVPVIAERL